MRMLLFLSSNQIGDHGLASLLAEPMQGVLPSFAHQALPPAVHLSNDLLTDSGLAAFASKVCSTALPALRELSVSGNPASEEAQKALLAGLAAAMQQQGRSLLGAHRVRP